MLLELARVFCQNTSIRGVGKIFKAPSACLRALWLIYVLSMFAFLVHSTSRLFKDYLEYSTIIQTSTGNESEKTEFPSLTFCNHHPFSNQAKEYWRSGKVMSPRKWNDFLRNNLKQCIRNRTASNNTIACGINQFLYDTKRMYYQNLGANDAELIGHKPEDSILLCVASRGSILTAGTPKDCDIEVSQISLVKYFNCFTVNANDATYVDKLILVINVGVKPDFGKYEQAFIPDIFEQAHGVRMVIHEPYTYPDIEAKGDQVEPGKMVEVSYYPIRVEEIKTPKKPCYDEANQYPLIQDLNHTFNYTYESCYSMKVGLNALEQCECFYADHLRPGVPNKTHPYCGEIYTSTEKQLVTRRSCLQMKGPQFTAKAAEGCHRRCSYYEYHTRTSITKWRPTQWQVYWARNQLKNLNALYEMYQASNKRKARNVTISEETRAKHAETELKSYEVINEYLESDNLTKIKQTPNSTKSSMQAIPTNADDFVYIVLSRQKSTIFVKENKLTLTLNGLVSRIGGLCSLYLGLTCAFGVELIEFLYLIKKKYSQPKEKTVDQSDNKKADENHESRSKDTNTNNNNYFVSDEPMMSGRYSPMYGMSSYLCDNASKSDDESPWKPRVPLNSTSL